MNSHTLDSCTLTSLSECVLFITILNTYHFQWQPSLPNIVLANTGKRPSLTHALLPLLSTVIVLRKLIDVLLSA